MTIQSVAKFMMLGGQIVPADVDYTATPSELFKFLDLVTSEHNETFDGILENDKAEILDGFLDIAYAAMTGAIRAVGPQKAAMAWSAICDANLAKVDGRHGPVIVNNETGKILKPEGWTPPDIEAIIERTLL